MIYRNQKNGWSEASCQTSSSSSSSSEDIELSRSSDCSSLESASESLDPRELELELRLSRFTATGCCCCCRSCSRREDGDSSSPPLLPACSLAGAARSRRRVSSRRPRCSTTGAQSDIRVALTLTEVEAEAASVSDPASRTGSSTGASSSFTVRLQRGLFIVFASTESLPLAAVEALQKGIAGQDSGPKGASGSAFTVSFSRQSQLSEPRFRLSARLERERVAATTDTHCTSSPSTADWAEATLESGNGEAKKSVALSKRQLPSELKSTEFTEFRLLERAAFWSGAALSRRCWRSERRASSTSRRSASRRMRSGDAGWAHTGQRHEEAAVGCPHRRWRSSCTRKKARASKPSRCVQFTPRTGVMRWDLEIYKQSCMEINKISHYSKRIWQGWEPKLKWISILISVFPKFRFRISIYRNSGFEYRY